MAVNVNQSGNAEGDVTSTGGEAARSTQERGREWMSILDFVTDARGGEARRAIILAGTFASGANDTAAVQAAIDWAMDDATGRWLYVPGDFTCTSDLTNVHDVHMYGPGSIKVGTGARWYVSADRLNTGFSPLGYNTLYVNPTGSDVNSGMAPEFAVATLQAAVDKFLAHDSGFKKIQLAAGVYRDEANLNSITSDKSRRLYVVGPTQSAWDNSAPPTEPVSISAITSANPAVVTAAGHGRSVNDQIMIFDAVKAASAEHESVGQIFTITGVSGNDLTLNADGSAWSAYVGSGRILDLTGSSPTAIFLGYKDTETYAITLDNGDYVDFNDITFVNWGTRTLSQNAGAIKVAGGSCVATLTNVHAYQCAHRVDARDFCNVYTSGGGYVWNCGAGDWAVGGARYTFGGDANPGTATLTTSTLYHKCIRAWDIWENCSGHCDGSIVLDCDGIGKIFGGSHAVSYYNRYTNTTGGALEGWIVGELGNLSRSSGSTDVVSGSFRNLVDRRLGTVIYSGDTGDSTRRQMQLLYRDTPNTTTANGTQQTLATYTIPQHMHTNVGDTFKIRAKFILGAGNVSNVDLRIKVNGTNFYTWNIPGSANQQSGYVEQEWTQNGSAFARASVILRVFDTATGTLNYERYSNFTPAFDPASSALPITITMTVQSGDVGQITVVEFYSDAM